LTPSPPSEAAQEDAAPPIEFEDDFIDAEVIEDDFIDGDEPEQLQMLGDVTSMLEQSITQRSDVKAWAFRQSDR
jgi:hypothetical protein